MARGCEGLFARELGWAEFRLRAALRGVPRQDVGRAGWKRLSQYLPALAGSPEEEERSRQTPPRNSHFTIKLKAPSSFDFLTRCRDFIPDATVS